MGLVTLWHSSRYGITGSEIRPQTAVKANGEYILHDFEPGFYAGTDEASSAELIGRTGRYDGNPDIVRVEFDEDIFKDECRIYRFTQEDLTDWALFVAYSRGYFDRGTELPNINGDSKGSLSKLYPYVTQQMETVNNNDIIIGPIADDRMLLVYNMFLEESMGIKCLNKCLLEANYCTQYVFKTKKACGLLNQYGNVKIPPFSRFLSENDLSIHEIARKASAREKTIKRNVSQNIRNFLTEGDKENLSITALLDLKEEELFLRHGTEVSYGLNSFGC